MVIAFLVFLGLSLGSFVNALVWRLREQSKYLNDDGKKKKLTKAEESRYESLSISKGRSMCAHCGHPLAAKDLVPVLSWLYLRGKCRYCSKRIDDTPVAELLVPLLLVLSYLWWPFAAEGWTALGTAIFAVWSLIVTCFVALMIYDAKWFLLPDRIVWPLTGLAAIFVGLRALDADAWGIAISAALGAVVLSGVFWLLHAVSKGRWIGRGDVKLALSLGLIVGTPLMSVLTIFLASVLGTIASVPALMKPGGMKRSLPFGPHLIAATFIVLFFGTSLYGWYMALLAS